LENKKYKTINFEGCDQVGKGDATLNFSKEVSNLGFDTCVVSFPYYSTPFGFLLRKILVSGFPKEVLLKKGRDIEIKMLLFAINRLEILNCIMFSKSFDLYIFDRGPFSNALTIGYYIFQTPVSSKKRNQLVKKAMEFDSLFREILIIDDCVICLRYSNIEWERNRGEYGNDLYERRDVQDIGNEIYNIFEKEIGKGWKNVVTKGKEGWKSRDDIKKECMEFAIECNVVKKNWEKGKGKLEYFGIEKVQEFLYRGSVIEGGIKRDWLSALRSNDKNEVYRVSEIISSALVGTTELLVWEDADIKGYVGILLNKYPEIFDIIECEYSKLFRDKFERSLQ
jgi:thymidylate kinase